MLSEIFAYVLPETSQNNVLKLNKDHGLVFGADIKSDPRIIWTSEALKVKEYTYITSSTFFGRKRQRRFTRHVLAFVSDFDTPAGTTFEDVLDNYRTVGLPLPELILSTPTPGHFQAWNILEEPLRIRHDILLAKINKVHEMMVEVLGADPGAVGVERWVRRPSTENLVYYDSCARTSWHELLKWYESRRPLKEVKVKSQKVVYVGTLLATPAGRRIQESAAEKGERNRWAFALGLCLWDAGISASEIHTKLHTWNKNLQEPLSITEIEKIYRSILTGRHHASPRVLSSITGISAQIKGWYKWAKPRDRRRDHIYEVKEDIISDLLQNENITQTQKAWAECLGVAYRTLKEALSQLRREGIVEAYVGHGRHAQSSYGLSKGYLKSLASSELQVAARTEVVLVNETLKGHTAISPLKGTLPFSPILLSTRKRIMRKDRRSGFG